MNIILYFSCFKICPIIVIKMHFIVKNLNSGNILTYRAYRSIIQICYIYEGNNSVHSKLMVL